MRGWFVTGTDTGVGKTFVTAALARELRARGQRVAAIKPAESGCRRGPEGLFAEDAETIAAAAGSWQAPDARCLYRFEEPVAPGVAAERTGTRIDLEAVARFVATAAADAARVLVEGAGGWLVPLGESRTIADLAERLAWPVVVVARATLGTINHSLLTVEAIERRGLEVAALILSQRPDDEARATESNADEIRKHWRDRVWILGPAGWAPNFPAAAFHVER